MQNNKHLAGMPSTHLYVVNHTAATTPQPLPVHHRPIFDVPRPTGVLEGVQVLVQHIIRAADTRNHQRLAVATEAVLQEPRQLRVPVWNVAAWQPSLLVT